MTFEEMWEKADLEDAACGGMDSVPEGEQLDYRGALLMANGFVWAGLILGNKNLESVWRKDE